MEQNEELYEIEVVYKSPPFSSMKRVKSPEDIVMVFRELITEEKIDYKEFFVVALLNRANALLGVSKISVGSACGIDVNVREIFQLALKINATGIILCHNHPSGNLNPSNADITMTKRIISVCGFCDLVLLDHILLTKEGYTSLMEMI